MAGYTHGEAEERLEVERRAFLDLLQMASTLAEPEEIARQLVILARQLSGCEAAAIRLKDGPGFPYAACEGFPERFVSLEDDLCATDEEGHLLRDDQRQPILTCLCGRVLSGRVDLTQPVFTDQGSFVASSSGALLAAPSEAQRMGLIPNRCHVAGYETIGLFPIRRDGRTYGLIQCNDHRPGRLSAKNIGLMEHLAATAAHLFELTAV